MSGARTTTRYDSCCTRPNRTSYTYSSLSQLTSRKYPDGSRGTFSYDVVGNRTLMADSTGRYTSLYNASGQTTAVRSPNSQSVTFTYTAAGQRRSMDATNSGRRAVQRNANGTRVSTVSDVASQTTQVFHRTSAGAAIQQLDYRYDNAGNRKVMIEGGGSARVSWSYDKQNQLTGEYRTGTNAYRQTFTYDAGGNRTLKNIDATRTTYAYDANGNQQIEQPAVGNRTTTTWNYENQPTLCRLPTGSRVTMIYNGDNRRVRIQEP